MSAAARARGKYSPPHPARSQHAAWRGVPARRGSGSDAGADAIQANQAASFLATFRAIVKKYPKESPATVLHDLVESTPGQEGKWFAAAKDAGLYDEAIALATRTPCDPRTLTRAARDFVTQNPAFAIKAGLAALRWIMAGHGYEITVLDVSAAYSQHHGCCEQCRSGQADPLTSAGNASRR